VTSTFNRRIEIQGLFKVTGRAYTVEVISLKRSKIATLLP